MCIRTCVNSRTWQWGTKNMPRQISFCRKFIIRIRWICAAPLTWHFLSRTWASPKRQLKLRNKLDCNFRATFRMLIVLLSECAAATTNRRPCNYFSLNRIESPITLRGKRGEFAASYAQSEAHAQTVHDCVWQKLHEAQSYQAK